MTRGIFTYYLIIVMVCFTPAALAQKVTGCSGSGLNIAIGALGKNANSLAAHALDTRWPPISKKLLSKLASVHLIYGGMKTM
jgi:hypothetical protein